MAMKISEFSVAVLAYDIVGFTALSAAIGPEEVVTMLDRYGRHPARRVRGRGASYARERAVARRLYYVFDEIIASTHAYKIETVGDAVLVCAGAPTRLPSAAAIESVVNCARDMMYVVSRFRTPTTRQAIQARIGLHYGNVLAGIMGHILVRARQRRAARCRMPPPPPPTPPRPARSHGTSSSVARWTWCRRWSRRRGR